MNKDDEIVSRRKVRRERKTDGEKKREENEELLSVRRLFLSLTLGRPLHLSFACSFPSFSLFLSTRFPILSPFLARFLPLLAAGTWAWTWAR